MTFCAQYFIPFVITAIVALALASGCDAHWFARPKLIVTDRWICAAGADATWCAVPRSRDASQLATARVRVAGPALRLGTEDFDELCAWEREDRRRCGDPSGPLENVGSAFSAPVGARYEPPCSLHERRPPGDGDGYACRQGAQGIECAGRPRAALRGPGTHAGPGDLLVEPNDARSQERRWQRHRSAIAALPSVYEVALSADTACVLFGPPRLIDGAFAMRCFDDRGAFDPPLVALEITASSERLCARTPRGVYCVGELGVLSAAQSACPRVGDAVLVSGGPFRALHESLPCAITAGATAELRCWGRNATHPAWLSLVQPLTSPPVAFSARDAWVQTANGAWAPIEVDPQPSTPPNDAEQNGQRSVSASRRCEVTHTRDGVAEPRTDPARSPSTRPTDTQREGSAAQDRDRAAPAASITCWLGDALQPWTTNVESAPSRIALRAQTLCALFDGAVSCWNLRSRRRVNLLGTVALQSDGAVCRYDERGRVECAWINEHSTEHTLVWTLLAERGARYVLSRTGKRCFIDDAGVARCMIDGATRRMFAGLRARATSLSMQLDSVCALFDDGRVACEGQPGLCNEPSRVQQSTRAFVPMGL